MNGVEQMKTGSVAETKTGMSCMRPLIIILLALLLAGCSFKTVIVEPDGREYTVLSQKDALVHAKLSNGVDLTVDNRGNGGIMSDIIKAWSLKWITEDAE
jgi:hypothetical protein